MRDSENDSLLWSENILFGREIEFGVMSLPRTLYYYYSLKEYILYINVLVSGINLLAT